MKNLHTQAGMTLVELMVASLIALILLAGVGQIFLSTKQLNLADTTQAEMQDTARYLFHYLAEQVRQAGMMGCAKLDALHYSSSISAYDGNYAHPFHIGIQGFRATPASLPSPLDTLPIAGGSDVLVVRRSSELGFRLVKEPSNTALYAEHLETKPKGCHNGSSDRINGICSDDILIAVDCQKGRSFVASSLSTAQENGNTIVTIEHASGNTPSDWGGPASSNPLDKFDPRDTVLNKAATTAYYITSDGNLYAKVNSDPSSLLASGIEYLRIRYGLDTDDDGSVNKYLDAEQISTDPEVVENFQRVVSLQLALLLRSQAVVLNANELGSGSVSESYTLLDTPLSRTRDGYIRKVYSATIQLRNGGV